MYLETTFLQTERIAKSLTEGHKFQESILINSSLTSVGKVQKPLISQILIFNLVLIMCCPIFFQKHSIQRISPDKIIAKLFELHMSYYAYCQHQSTRKKL